MNRNVIIIILLGISLNTFAQSIIPNNTTMTNLDQSNIEVFISNFKTFSMDIQAAGLAKIPVATLSITGELYIEYAYHSTGENRNGKMTLAYKQPSRYEGKWKTLADNGNSYEGTLYFVFDEHGEAEGHYEFGGSQYSITINKKKE